MGIFAQTRTEKRPAPAAPGGDIKIRARTTMSGQSFESTQYVKGVRERSEMQMSGGFVSLTQCDLNRSVQVNDRAKTYLVQPFAAAEPRAPEAPGRAPSTQPAPARQRGGVVTYVYTTTDTGERKEMFGYTARRLKTTVTTETTPEACNSTKLRMDTDGWYIDLTYGADCQNRVSYAAPMAGARPDCQDVVKSRTVGNGKPGFALDLTTTFYNDNGTTTVSKREVLELSRAALDAALFEVPADYREAKDYQQLMGLPTSAAADAGGADEAAGRKPAPAQKVPAAAGAKKPGILRVGVVLPKTRMGQGYAGADVTEAVRNTLIQYLNSAAVEVTAVQAEFEAKEKECDFLLYTSVTHKEGGGGLGGFLKKASPLAGISVSGAGATGASGPASSTAEVANNTRARDEITVEYRLVSIAGTSPTLTNALRAKAKSDREDLLAPLLEQVAAAVVKAVTTP